VLDARGEPSGRTAAGAGGFLERIERGEVGVQPPEEKKFVNGSRILALLAGFATMAVLVMGLTALVTWLAPEWAGAEGKPNPGYAFVNLGYSFYRRGREGMDAWRRGQSDDSRAGAGDGLCCHGGVERAQERGKQPSGTH